MSRLVVFVFALMLSLIYVPLIRLVARKCNAWSIIDFRRQNKSPVPLFGGVAVALTFGVGTVAWHSFLGLKLFLCALPLLVVGVLDDVFELSARSKFISQAISAGLWLAIQQPGTLIMDQSGLNHLFAKAISLVWILGITNGFNLIDGMDGIVGGVTIIFSFFLTQIVPPEFGTALILLAGAMMGFLFYNFPPARIYLGDSGSTFAGFIMACSCTLLKLPYSNSRPDLLVPLLLLSLPLLDTALAITRRILRGQNVFEGDKDHLHHRLRRLGLSDLEVLGIICTVCFYTSLAAYEMWIHKGIDKLMILFLATAPLISIVVLVHYTENRISKLINREPSKPQQDWNKPDIKKAA